MKILNNFFKLILIILLISCSKNDKVSIVKEKNIETQMIEAFKEGYDELENGDVLFAAKKFNGFLIKKECGIFLSFNSIIEKFSLLLNNSLKP